MTRPYSASKALGGDNGLRGYPLRYQSGDYAAMFTLAQRVWKPDGGADFGPGLLSDVGPGLRTGSPRSSTGRMLHIDLAWPLDGSDEMRGAQLVIETTSSF